MSGTYKFGLYDNAEGSGDALEIISIHFDPKDKDVKSAKFNNPVDLKKNILCFRIRSKGRTDSSFCNRSYYKFNAI